MTLTGNLQYAGKCTVRAGRGHARKKDWKNLWENGFQWWWTFNETGVHRGLYEGPSPVSNAYGGCGYQPIMVPNRLFHFIYSSRFTKKLKKIIVCCTVRVALWHRDPLDQRICFHVIDIANILNTQKDWGNLSWENCLH